jgi:hypothetical protein
VRLPSDKIHAVVNQHFLNKFGNKLREIFCISNIQGYPENIIIFQDITGYVDPELLSPESPSPEPPMADTPSEAERRRRTASNPEPPTAAMKIRLERYQSDSDPFK